jgi:diamine N-acetyltransferase
MGTCTIRTAQKGDEALIVALLRELADYEKLLDRFHITPDAVTRDYFCDTPLLFCDIAFEGDKPAGLATWHWTYGSFATKRKIYLADLFVRPEFRGKQYGKALIGNLAKRVIVHGGAGIDWEVLDWNKPSIDFYDSLGATSIKNWVAYNLSGDALERLAKS